MEILQSQTLFLTPRNYYKTCNSCACSDPIRALLFNTPPRLLIRIADIFQHEMSPMSLSLSMAAFALAASISPGPVNIVALASGARHGLRASLRHVVGASLGFCLLLIVIGLGLHELLVRWPLIGLGLHWGGVLFLLYLAWRLASDKGGLGNQGELRAPSAWHGAAMQWLNPKAWLAALAGVGAYTGGEQQLLWLFIWIYGPICFVSIASWAWAGSVIGQYLGNPRYMRVFNRTLAALLVASALYLVME